MTIPKGPDRELEQQIKEGREKIFKLLMDIEGTTQINWEESFSKFSWMAEECANKLTKIKYIIDHRKKEEMQGKKRKPSESIRKEADSYCTSEEQISFKALINKRFQHDISYLEKMLKLRLSLPDNLEENLDLSIDFAMAIQGAFYSLKCMDEREHENDIPVKTILRLYGTFTSLLTKTKDLRILINEREKIRDRNSQNQKKSDQKRQKLEEIKLHPKYTEFIKAMGRYVKTGKGKDKSILNNLLQEMTGVKNLVTLRCYRNELLEEYVNSKK